MLKSLYNSLGVTGSVFTFLLGFMLFVFWFAGLSGLIHNKAETTAKNRIFLAIAIIFPPIPITWMIFDMIRQRRDIGSITS